jgi:hypothetical protein
MSNETENIIAFVKINNLSGITTAVLGLVSDNTIIWRLYRQTTF